MDLSFWSALLWLSCTVRARSSRTSARTVITVHVSGAHCFDRIARSVQKIHTHMHATNECARGLLAPVFHPPSRAPFRGAQLTYPCYLPSLCTTRWPHFASQPQDNTAHEFRLAPCTGQIDWSAGRVWRQRLFFESGQAALNLAS